MPTPLRSFHDPVSDREVGVDEIDDWTDLLEQDRVWMNANRELLALDDMDPSYCERVRQFCLRNADAVITNALYAMTLGPGPSGSVACDGFNREFDHLSQIGSAPEKWMAEQPLVIALQRRAQGLPARSDVCCCGYPFKDDAGDWDHSACYPGIIVD